MPRLARPYIPLSVRVQVAEGQCIAAGYGSLGSPVLYKRLAYALEWLFGNRKAELHHRPALVNRRRYVRGGKVFYDPPANDPAHLVYLAEDDHDVETRVRGLGAQRSDLGQRRYNKKVARNRKRIKNPRKDSRRHFRSPVNKLAANPKSIRPLRSANRWTAKRAWGAGPLIHWNLLNPSLADGKRDDPTMLRMIGFSYRWGFGSLVATNTYPVVSPTTDKLRAWRKTWDWETYQAAGMPSWEFDKGNWSAFHHGLGIIGACAATAALSVAAWGAGVDEADLQQLFEGARRAVDTSEHDGFGDIGVPIAWMCIGTNADGSPRHPLSRGRSRVPDDAVLQPWRPA